MKELDVQNAIFNHVYSQGRLRNYPNLRRNGVCGEADLLSVTNKLECYEYEIKLSKSDFRADFKKVHKHEVLADKDLCERYDGPNFFYYVAPVGLLEVSEIPSYAGLYEVSNAEQSASLVGWVNLVRLRIKKRAPRLHKKAMSQNRLSNYDKAIMYQFWTQRLRLARP